MKKNHPASYYSGLFVAFDLALLLALISVNDWCDLRMISIIVILSILIPYTIHLWLIAPSVWPENFDPLSHSEGVWIHKIIAVSLLNVLVVSLVLSKIYWISGILFSLASLFGLRRILKEESLRDVALIILKSFAALFQTPPKNENETS
jgi:hypothetical protein